MLQHEVDFIGRDVNLSAFSTAGDVFSDDEFAAPDNAHLRGIGGLGESDKDRTGFLTCPGARTHGEFRNTDATCSTMQASGSRQAI